MLLSDRNPPKRSDQLLIVVARAPVPGQTKTRLGDSIGMERAAALHRAFLTDLAQRFVPAGDEDFGYDFAWAYTPSTSHFSRTVYELDPMGRMRRAEFVPQSGDDLTSRLTNLFRWGNSRGYHRIVILASDSPQLEFETATEAFLRLRSTDVVLGRVDDGGYYLVGMRGFHDVVNTRAMGTGDAASALVSTALSAGLTAGELTQTYDVDIAADLATLIADLSPDGRKAPATWKALAELDLLSSYSVWKAPGPTRTAISANADSA